LIFFYLTTRFFSHNRPDSYPHRQNAAEAARKENPMINIDFVLFDGNLTQDPEARIVGDNKRLTTFSVAINHPSGKEDRDGVSYIPVETWGKLAENCAKYLVKGSRVTVEGALRQERWQDDQGKNHSRIKILARNVRFENSKKQEAA